jgi:hypothetical protein
MSEAHKVLQSTACIIFHPKTGHFIQGGRYTPRIINGMEVGGVSYTAHRFKAEKFEDTANAKAFISRHGLKEHDIQPA